MFVIACGRETIFSFVSRAPRVARRLHRRAPSPLTVSCASVQWLAMAHLRDSDTRPPLGVRPIVAELEALARARGLRKARVGYKLNARGEHVVALIFEGFAGSGGTGQDEGGPRGAKPMSR